jgi:streptogramin lyase
MVAVASIAVYEVYSAGAQSPCLPFQGNHPVRSQVENVTFGGVTEFNLPSPGRDPNAIAVAPDGSVWFTEMEVPGVAHLYPDNGTLVEYPWSGYPPPTNIAGYCSPQSEAFGIALWNGRVWGADLFNNVIVGVSPSDGSVVKVNTTNVAPYPYWLSVGPDGALWFTSENTPPRLGRIAPNLSMSIIALQGLGQDEPIQLTFVNSSLAYLAAINQQENKTTQACICTGHIYSFDPASVSSTITPTLVGGNYTLVLPTSVAYSNGMIWVTQHDASSIVGYDVASGKWTNYPTTAEPFVGVTLPLVVEASGSEVWFNEHYANKIAHLNPGTDTLTEYSETKIPISNGSQIQNDESIALAPGRLWFTSISGNYLGFVNTDYNPGFNVTVSGTNTAILGAGGSASFSLKVSGTWSEQMQVNVSDSENLESIPKSIQILPSTTVIQPGVSPFDLGVKVTLGQSLPQGDYTIAVTVTDGYQAQVAYIFIAVK